MNLPRRACSTVALTPRGGRIGRRLMSTTVGSHQSALTVVMTRCLFLGIARVSSFVAILSLAEDSEEGLPDIVAKTTSLQESHSRCYGQRE